jgi:hypothetical protein
MGHDVGLADMLLAVTLYMVTGLASRPVSTALSRSFTVSSSLPEPPSGDQPG